MVEVDHRQIKKYSEEFNKRSNELHGTKRICARFVWTAVGCYLVFCAIWECLLFSISQFYAPKSRLARAELGMRFDMPQSSSVLLLLLFRSKFMFLSLFSFDYSVFGRLNADTDLISFQNYSYLFAMLWCCGECIGSVHLMMSQSHSRLAWHQYQ